MNPVAMWGEPKFCQPINKAYAKQITCGDVCTSSPHQTTHPTTLMFLNLSRAQFNAFLFLFFDNFSSLLAILAEMIFIPKIVLNFVPGFVPVGSGAYVNTTAAEYLTANTNMVFSKVCPGIAFALLFGNVWYAWMAMKLAGKEDRKDVTALPYGINTPAGFLTVFMVMLPILFYYNPAQMEISPEELADRSFKGGCAANFLGGLFEVFGLVIGEFMRKNIPRAALFGPVCGVGFVWLGFNPLIAVMREPIVGMMPLFFTFTAFFANGGKGWYSQKIPMAAVIMLIGTILWWIGLSRHDTEKRELNNPPDMGLALQDALDNLAFKNNMSPFVTMGGFSYMKDNAVAIVFPIALASFIETIENVEMASIVGDSYNVKEAMLADGCGTIVGALFGSVIPTTVYIGHKRHKVAGAHYFYSVLNALAYFILLLSGLMPFFFYSIDEIAISCILIAVGLMIVEQALEASVPRHYPCLMIGIMFLIADMLYFDHFDATVRVATRSIGRMKGVMNMAPGGGIMCSLIVPAILCDLIDARFGRAAIFCTIACIFSLFGIMHGANYHQPDGMMIPAMGADESDYYTTDLGELTVSLPIMATYESWQSPFLASIGVGFISSYSYTYRTEDLGFDDPYRCPPWMQTSPEAGSGASSHLNTYGLPCPAPTKQHHVYNEGWRFAVAYFFGILFCLAHYAVANFAMKGSCVAVMDNGAANADLAVAPKKAEQAEA